MKGNRRWLLPILVVVAGLAALPCFVVPQPRKICNVLIISATSVLPAPAMAQGGSLSPPLDTSMVLGIVATATFAFGVMSLKESTEKQVASLKESTDKQVASLKESTEKQGASIRLLIQNTKEITDQQIELSEQKFRMEFQALSAEFQALSAKVGEVNKKVDDLVEAVGKKQRWW